MRAALIVRALSESRVARRHARRKPRRAQRRRPYRPARSRACRRARGRAGAAAARRDSAREQLRRRIAHASERSASSASHASVQRAQPPTCWVASCRSAGLKRAVRRSSRIESIVAQFIVGSPRAERGRAVARDEQLGKPLPRAMQAGAHCISVDGKDLGELLELVPLGMQRQQRTLLGVEPMPNGGERARACAARRRLDRGRARRSARCAAPSSSAASATNRKRRRRRSVSMNR